MSAFPAARLVLLAPPGRHRERLSERLAARGVDAARIRFVPFQPRARYLDEYHEIDLGLDTLPYNGHTTSLDSCWMGVPVISRMGGTCAGRGGLSQLFNLELLELAAATDAAFLNAAVALGEDLPRLAALRQELRGRLARSPLMDGKRFAQNVEAVYRRIWQEYCAR
jgi:predicted O-linked N-acetylglucosamine transferase (SPINDLY family)